VDGIRRLLGHADSDVRRRAVELLGTLPDVAANAAFALPCLEDKDEDCRLSAVELLGKLAQEALAPHLNAVVKRLQDEEECVRMGAVVVIGTLPAATLQPFTATLLSMLEDPSWRVRRHAMEVSVPLHADGLPHRMLMASLIAC
jgi:HEAT repeat protein